jgi:hypothetical protein
MAATLKTTIDNFPEILSKNASSLMQRIILKTKESLTDDSHLSNASACNFFLKTATKDLVTNFESILKSSLYEIKLKQASGKNDIFGLALSLTLDSEGDEEQLAIAKMKSMVLFEKLCAKGKENEISGVGTYDVKLFMNAMREAFHKSKFEDSELSSIFPHAIRALDSELIQLYEKLDCLEV